MAEPEVSLDKALERLESIADKLEDPALDLDEAVRLYEEGLRLYAECDARICPELIGATVPIFPIRPTLRPVELWT